MIYAVLMASGYSKRMGNNKLLLKYKEKSIIEHVMHMLKMSKVDEVIVVARDEGVKKIGKDNFCIVLHNHDAKEGISASIKIGCDYGKFADGILFVPGDQPLLTVDTINKLIDAFYGFKDKIIVPCYEDVEGSPVIFPNKYFDKLMKLKGDMGGRKVIEENIQDKINVMIKNKLEHLDVDTMKDYKKLARIE
ncbi:nucleotidyltransferase family protein [Marinisporobacter balticus]|uniref:Molybdenum cofactor cytidylyltransferase n=1 Tax=Marinisporobacter balticus TaxID=2018667 RepID=A0A4R2KKT0_9FIRM|nr:nucleotidyltransferase family protein [Marinisporobacter balticus]TCO74621.1 molybdenum cofactor cytidylyltransferase [Marinisporobacter balticus]